MLTILGVRAEFDAQTLRSITASALVARFVDMGLIGEEGLRKLKLGEVLVDGDIASAVALNGATPAGFSYLFAKEQGRWKLDLTSLNDAADPHLINAAHDAGLPMPAYIDSVLEARYGAARVKQLHHPLGP
ncbi:MAG: hypothetical protein QOJ92_314 [Frankiales bacterium]|nr:hypothetical protein [Frankiales bacterium]